MRLRRRGTATIILIVVLVALPVIGFVQYLWLTEASEGEAAQLRRSLETAVRQIRTTLTVELGSLRTIVGQAFPALSDPSLPEVERLTLESLPGYLQAWTDRSQFPDILVGVYLVDRSAGTIEIRRFDPVAGVFTPLAGAQGVPAELLSRPDSALSGTQDGGRSYLRVRALTRYERAFSPRELWSDMRASRETPISLYVVVDQGYLATTVLPQLVSEFLGPDPGYDMAVADHGSGSVLYSTVQIGYAQLISGQRGAPDEVVDIWSTPAVGGIFLENERASDEPGEGSRMAPLPEPIVEQWLGIWEMIRPGDPERPAAPTGPETAAPGDRQGVALYLWHPMGSILHAARADRNRNLLASYIVLALLAGASVGFYIVSRRATQLRDREREFVATVTHELRTPIAAMHAAADNLAEGIITRPDQVREYGRALLDEGRRLRRMVDQVLLYAGLQGRGQMAAGVNLDIQEIARATPSRVSEIRRDQLRVDIEPGLPRFRGDRIAVESIVTNLLSNAAKHNPPETRISLRVRGEATDGRYSLVIQVEDDGNGIPRGELRRVAEPFFRGTASQERQVPGSGLGLSLVRRIVQTCGGTMRIDSSHGHGTSVTVRLPFEHADE